MASLFRQHALFGVAVQLIAEAMLYFWAVVLGVYIHRQFPPGVWTVHAFLPALAFAVLMVIISGAVGLYRGDGMLASKNPLVRVALATSLGVPVAYAMFSVIPNGWIAQRAIGNVLLLTLVGSLLLRHLVAAVLRQGWFQYRVLVVGTGPEARAVEQALSQRGLARAILTCFYPVGPARDSAEHSVDSLRIVSRDVPLDKAVQRLRIDEVIVAVREQRGGVLPLRQLLDCRARGVRITGRAEFLERVRGEVPLDALKASWLIYGDGFRQGVLRAIIKRTMDIAAATLLLILTAPVMLVIALAIRMEGPGQVVYRQERVGRGGKPFVLLKFRSMRTDAERDGKAQWATLNDSRVTRIGRFIRRARIDELPQLWNVLRGEMSFVGPRPERPTFVEQLKTEIPFYDLRHSVKPGLTGWAQVRFPYGASTEDAAKKLQFDLYYVKNHSPFLDVVIVLETARVVLLGEGAR